MITRIISLLMSFVVSVSGMLFTSFNNIIDSVSEMIFGIPYTSEAVKSDFFEEIEENDVVAVDKNNGFIKDLTAVFIEENLSFAEKLALFGKTGGVLVGWSTVTDLYVIRYPAMDYDAVNKKCEELAKLDGIVFAMPVTTNKSTPDTAPDDPFDKYDFTYPEWDELNPCGSNWWLEAIQARQAWDYSDYFNTVNIGIIESGIEVEHPEFEGKISFPSARHAKRNYGDFHGCHVAGIIGARHNNGTGIAGICDDSHFICVDWSPDLLQFWNTELAIFFGFADVVKAGAKVVNFSLGISGSKTNDGNSLWEEYFSTAALSLMMSSLLSKGYDFVAVQSAGNGDYYGEPMNANYNGHFASLRKGNILTYGGLTAEDLLDRIIVVASAKYDGYNGYVQSDFTNVGGAVSIAAPGEEIYSCSTNGEYEYLSGTSMAAPMVTGVASLVWSVNPGFTGAEVKEIVCGSANDVAIINRSHEYAYDVELMDYPMLNAKLAVEKAIMLTDSDFGTVSGKIIGEKASEIIFNEKTYTLFSDGTYSFVAPESDGIAIVVDETGNEIGSFLLTVEAGKETSAGEYAVGTDIVPEPEETQPAA